VEYFNIFSEPAVTFRIKYPEHAELLLVFIESQVVESLDAEIRLGFLFCI
jgi:hypothetical protein